MEYFKNLPVEIKLEIFSRLPAELVLECKSVCTSWNKLISHHPSFRRMHIRRHNHPSTDNESGKSGGFITSTFDDNFHYIEYKDDDELTTPIQRIRRINLTPPIRDSLFVGSCNGLICIARGPLVSISNPITREQVVLPKIKRYCNLKQYRFWTCGFGYISSTNEYKIVGIYTAGEVYIYTLGSGKGWRKLGVFNFESNSKELDQGIFANGTVYWLDRALNMIIAFDLVEEKFLQNISPPPLPTHEEDDVVDIRIGAVDGVLYIAVSSVVLEGGGGHEFDVWLLEKKSDNHEMKEKEEYQSSVWSRECRIDQKKLFALTKSGGVLTYNNEYLSIYDTKTSTSKRLVKFKSWLLRVSPHKNTLISLKELGEEDTETLEPVDIEKTRHPDYSFEQL